MSCAAGRPVAGILGRMSAQVAPYSRPEEQLHALTAGLGIVACTVGIPCLVWVSRSDPWKLASALVFGISALAMFVTSVFYHHERDLERKVRLRKLDHAAIYLLIAGTYTPIALIAMGGAWGWTLFGAMWTVAAIGIIAKATVGFRFPRLSLILYLAMGWVGMLAISPMTASLNGSELTWLIAGGLVYTAGTPFYAWKKQRYTHAVWHLFVLGGVACHFAAVMSVVGAAAPGG
jgi:hemolysin III